MTHSTLIQDLIIKTPPKNKTHTCLLTRHVLGQCLMFSDLSLEVLTTYTCVSQTHNSAVIPQFLFSISAPVKVSGSHIWWFELVLSKDYWCCRQWHAWFQVVSDQWSFRHLSLLQPNSALTTWPWTKLWFRSLDIKSLRGHSGMVSGMALM